MDKVNFYIDGNFIFIFCGKLYFFVYFFKVIYLMIFMGIGIMLFMEDTMMLKRLKSVYVYIIYLIIVVLYVMKEKL